MGILLLLTLAIGLNTTEYGKDLARVNNTESLKLLMGSPSLNYEFSNSTEEDNSFRYAPNQSQAQGLEIAFKDFTIALTEMDSIGHTEDVRGTSHLSDYQMYGIYKQFIWDAYYQSYQGFFIEESSFASLESYNSLGNADLRSLDSVNTGVNLTYAFNDKIPLKSLFGPNSLDRITGQTWTVTTGVNYFNIKSNDTLVPSEVINEFDTIADLNEVRTTSANIGIGWGGQYVFGNFYINGHVGLYQGQQKQELVNGKTKTQYRANSGNTALFDFGYKFKQSLLGIEAITQSTTTPLNSKFNIRQNRSFSSLYYNYFF
jgi:hypothetical protein